MTFSKLNLPPNTKLSRLTQDYDIKPFSCGEASLNRFLTDKAKIYQQHLLTVTNILDCNDCTIAFYSVSNDLLRIGANFSREFKSFLKQNISSQILYDLLDWDTFPAVKLDIFAVHKDFHRSGIGTVLMESILYNFKTNNKTGCFFCNSRCPEYR